MDTAGVSSAVAALSSGGTASSIAVAVLTSAEKIASDSALELISSLGVGTTVNTSA